MTNTTTPLTREQALTDALQKAADTFADLKLAMRISGREGYEGACRIAKEHCRAALASPGEPNEIKRMRAALAAGEEYVNALADALALPPTDLSGAMKYTGPGDAWPMPKGTK